MGIAVVDASVLVDALTGFGRRGALALQAVERFDLHAPAIVHIEALSGWRRSVRSGDLKETEAFAAVARLQQLELEALSVEPLLPRIWELRANMTSADASYVALAEQLGVPLLTCDARMTRAPGVRCEFQLIS